MNLNNISKLSDNQLVELYRNPSTVKEIKKRILKEIELRNLNYKENEITEDNEFSQNQILTLIFTPFLIRSHRKSMFKEKWSSK